MKTQSDSLRRKAHRLHRRADQARARGRNFDAAQLRSQAFNLEARADTLDTQVAPASAGFLDADLDALTGCTALPKGWC